MKLGKQTDDTLGAASKVVTTSISGSGRQSRLHLQLLTRAQLSANQSISRTSRGNFQKDQAVAILDLANCYCIVDSNRDTDWNSNFQQTITLTVLLLANWRVSVVVMTESSSEIDNMSGNMAAATVYLVHSVPRSLQCCMG